jgi:hypothetical protein
MAEKIAGSRFEYKGKEYNYGDAAPADLVEAHPDWVVDRTLSETEIDTMSKEELQAALKDQFGHVSATPAPATEAKKGGAKK